MLYAFYGLVCGLFIPYIARRFAKFMPATFAYALWQIVSFPRKKSEKKSAQYLVLRNKFRWRSVMSALITAGLFFSASFVFGETHLVWYCLFIWLLLLLAEIDWRMFLLPDILTIPLLLCGFFVSALGWGWISPQESAIAAFIGYFLPVVVSLLFVWKNKDAFGGGDIKLLSGLGAWLGLEKLLYVIVLSSVLFLLYALFARKRSGAYGPALAVAGIMVAFCFYQG